VTGHPIHFVFCYKLRVVFSIRFNSIYSVAGSKPMHSNTLGYNTIKNGVLGKIVKMVRRK